MRGSIVKILHKRSAAFALAAVLMATAVSVPSVLAYFTDYVKASGSKAVHLQWQTELKEDVRENDKHITIDNVGETPVVVRVQIFANEDLASISGSSWETGSDGWYYYKKILAAGEKMAEADELLVDVKGSDQLPDSDFNIVVIHESQRVAYESNTKLAAPDGWDKDAVAAIAVQ
ncbi:MAG: hypothetical protein J6D57_11455 [Mogibacterium sp.]|nr:hypothetical protein [Mogibacterium sp.]